MITTNHHLKKQNHNRMKKTKPLSSGSFSTSRSKVISKPTKKQIKKYILTVLDGPDCFNKTFHYVLNFTFTNNLSI